MEELVIRRIDTAPEAEPQMVQMPEAPVLEPVVEPEMPQPEAPEPAEEPAEAVVDQTEKAPTPAQKILRKLEGEMMKSFDMSQPNRLVFMCARTMGSNIVFSGTYGIAKTFAAKMMAKISGGKFGRIQGDDDVRPKDITGYLDLDLETRKKFLKKGVLENDMVLADELPRMQGKAQDGLIQGTEENEVTVQGFTYETPKRSFLIATGNHDGGKIKPVLLDRFPYSIQFDNLTAEDRMRIRKLLAKDHDTTQAITEEDMQIIEDAVRAVDFSEVETYGENLIDTVYNIDAVDLDESVYGGYRHSNALFELASFKAVYDGRSVASKEDINFAIYYVLGHRVVPTFEAQIDEKNPVTTQRILASAIQHVNGYVQPAIEAEANISKRRNPAKLLMAAASLAISNKLLRTSEKLIK